MVQVVFVRELGLLQEELGVALVEPAVHGLHVELVELFGLVDLDCVLVLGLLLDEGVLD